MRLIDARAWMLRLLIGASMSLAILVFAAASGLLGSDRSAMAASQAQLATGIPAVPPTPPPAVSRTVTLQTTPGGTVTVRTATALPPTPTMARPTPRPSGFFVSVYRGSAIASGIGASVVQGRVLDFQAEGIEGVQVRLRNGTVSPTTVPGGTVTPTATATATSTPTSTPVPGLAQTPGPTDTPAPRVINATAMTGPNGAYIFSNLPAGIYSVELDGYPSQPASGLQIAPGSIVTIDFQEAERPQPTARVTPGASAVGPTGTGSAPGTEVRPQVTPVGLSLVIVALTPEGAEPESYARPTPPVYSRAESTIEQISGALPWESWLEAFLLGMAATHVIVLLGLVAAGLRR